MGIGGINSSFAGSAYRFPNLPENQNAGKPAATVSDDSARPIGTDQVRANAQVRQRDPDVNLRGAVRSSDAKGFFATLAGWFKKDDPLMDLNPAGYRVSLENGATVTFTAQELAPMLKHVPKGKRAEARRHLVDSLQRRVANGQAIVKNVLAGRDLSAATVRDVSDITFYFKALAKKQGEDFVHGSFSVNDPDGRLARYFQNCPASYTRDSSHLGDLQNRSVDNHRNLQYGIDMPLGADGVPNGMRTVLFGTIPAENGCARRLFFKPETFGCHVNLFTRTHDASAYVGGRRSRGFRLADIPNVLGHTISFLTTRGDTGSMAARKESMPTDIKNAYKAFIATHATGPARQFVTVGLTKDEPMAKHRGIRYLMRNVNAMLADLQNGKVRFDDDTQAKLMRGLGEFVRFADHYRHGDINARLGNEVMLDIV